MTPRQEITRELVRALQSCEDFDHVLEALRHCPHVEKLDVRNLADGRAKVGVWEQKEKKTAVKAPAPRERTPVVPAGELTRLSGGVPRKTEEDTIERKAG